jgi:hypothetical protein
VQLHGAQLQFRKSLNKIRSHATPPCPSASPQPAAASQPLILNNDRPVVAVLMDSWDMRLLRAGSGGVVGYFEINPNDPTPRYFSALSSRAIHQQILAAPITTAQTVQGSRHRLPKKNRPPHLACLALRPLKTGLSHAMDRIYIPAPRCGSGGVLQLWALLRRSAMRAAVWMLPVPSVLRPTDRVLRAARLSRLYQLLSALFSTLLRWRKSELPNSAMRWVQLPVGPRFYSFQGLSCRRSPIPHGHLERFANFRDALNRLRGDRVPFRSRREFRSRLLDQAPKKA